MKSKLGGRARTTGFSFRFSAVGAFTWCGASLLLVLAACGSPSGAAFERVVGLSYDNARAQLIRDGWSPRKGVNDGMLSGNGRVFWERGYTELVASSGTGLAPCRFEFTDADGRVLVVGTEGEEIGTCHAKVVHAFIEQQGQD